MSHARCCAAFGLLHRPADIAADRVVGDVEGAARSELAVEHESGAWAVALCQPRLIEEARAHGPGLVEHRRFHERLHRAPAQRAHRDLTYLDGHRRALCAHELADRARIPAVTGQMLEQRSDAREPERAQALLDLARGDLERRLQPRRPRPAHRRGEQLRTGQAPARCELPRPGPFTRGRGLQRGC